MGLSGDCLLDIGNDALGPTHCDCGLKSLTLPGRVDTLASNLLR